MALLANRRSIMTLYSDSIHPEHHSVRLVLAEKGINFDLQLVDPENKPEELADLNPFDEILTLVDRDLVLYEPQLIMEYLDERFPHPPLMPVDPVSRANNRLFRYRVQRELYEKVQLILHGSEKKAATARRKLKEELVGIAPIFQQKKFFMSEEYSLMDCYLVTILWRLPAWGIELPAAGKPVMEYAKRIFAREEFQASLTEFERGMSV